MSNPMDAEVEPAATATTTTTTDTSTTVASQASAHPNNGIRTPNDESERRASIRRIMSDSSMSALEKRRQVQSLMDGRRRSSGSSKGDGGLNHSVSGNMSMMAQAAAAAAEFYNDSQEGEEAYMMGSMDSDDNDITTNGRQEGSSRPPSRTGSVSSNRSRGSTTATTFPRLGRSASLKNFAAGAAAAAAAASAALEASSEGGKNSTIDHARRMEKSRPRCEHYERNCTIISPCCGLAFGCRICHDESPVLPPPKPDPTHWADDMDVQKEQQQHYGPRLKRQRSLPTNFDDYDMLEELTHHEIDRFSIAQLICRRCYFLQSSKTGKCIQCDISFGEYHCSICNLWMSNKDRPYHCDKCGFCRVGGKENFEHCDDCGMCIDAIVFGDHNCKAGKYMSDCPVCQEDLFSSRSASHEMNCGHAIHWHCFQELLTYDSRCPVCKKTAESPEHMMATWSAMAMGIALQPVPPEMARVVNIICNDCEERSTDRRWHFLGVQCLKCSSFNTTVEQTTHLGREAAAYLGDVANDPARRTAQEDMDAMQESTSSFTDTEHLSAVQQRNLHEHLMSMAGVDRGQNSSQQSDSRMDDGDDDQDSHSL